MSAARRRALSWGALGLVAGAAALALRSGPVETMLPPDGDPVRMVSGRAELAPPVAGGLFASDAASAAEELEPREPHPVTAARRRLDEQHQLFDRVQLAVEGRDFAAARALLGDHRRHFSEVEGWHDLREGWEVIVDCLERPGGAARARAQHFVDTQRASRLRRRVRRTCLDS